MNTRALVATAALLSLGNAAFALDHFSLGSAAYNKRDYAKAKNEFQFAIKSKPSNWQAHYQLANTLLQLKDFAGATQAYRDCMNLKPSVEINQNCQNAITYLTAPRVPAKSAAPAVQAFSGSSHSGSSSAVVDNDEEDDTTPTSKIAASTTSHADDAHTAAMQARIKVIKDDEKRQLAALKTEEENAIQQGNAASNHRWRSLETGERFTMMNDDEKGEVMKEFDQKKLRIREETERRLKAATSQ